MRYFLVISRIWPLALIGLLLCFNFVRCQDEQESTSTESNKEAQRREGNAQQSENGKPFFHRKYFKKDVSLFLMQFEV